jgi:hypothetical protein
MLNQPENTTKLDIDIWNDKCMLSDKYEYKIKTIYYKDSDTYVDDTLE